MIIQNKINNLVSIAIFLLYNNMLSGHKKEKMKLGKFQDKTKFKRRDIAMQKMIVGKYYYCKEHLLWNMLNEM